MSLPVLTDAFKYSFIPRTITDWNSLPLAVGLSQSIQSFHGGLLSSASSYHCWSSWHSGGNGWSAPIAGYFNYFLDLNVEIVSLTSWWMLVYLVLIDTILHNAAASFMLMHVCNSCTNHCFYCIYTAYSVYSCLSSVYCFFMGVVAWFKINDDDDDDTSRKNPLLAYWILLLIYCMTSRRTTCKK